MFTQMLVPLDGSDISKGILPWAAHVSKKLDIPVVLASIVDPTGPLFQEEEAPPGLSLHVGRLPFLTLAADRKDNIGDLRSGAPAGFSDSGSHPSKKEIGEMARLDKRLRECVSTLEAQGVDVTESKVVSDYEDTPQAILNVARESGCDLLAMATHDRNLLERVFQGSVTHEVIRSAEFPVLAVTPEKHLELSGRFAEPTRLLVPLDGSDFAESVLPYVKELALRLSLDIVLVRWLTSAPEHSAPVGTGKPVSGDIRPGELAEPEEASELTAARRYLQSLATGLGATGLKVSWEIPEVEPNSPGTDLSQICAGGIIALASHGRSGLSRWIEGSVAEDLLRNSGCPVLVIPAALAGSK